MNQTYPDCLETIGLQIVGEFSIANNHHDIKCLLCGDVFKATPKSKMGNYKKHGMIGCPKCTKRETYKDENISMRNRLIDLGFEFTEFNTKLDEIEARNTNCECGRWWKTKPTYLLSERSFCRPCNDDKKRKRFDELNKERFQFICANHKSFQNYKKLVRHHSEKNYKKYIDTINPDNLPRGRVGQEGVYNLDHIVSQAFCWKMNIPAEVCGDISNLRMLDAMKNVVKQAKSVNRFPPIFDQYLHYRTKSYEFILSIQEEFNNIFEENFQINDHSFDLKYNDTLFSLLLFEENKESFNLNRRLNLNTYKAAKDAGFHYVPVFEHEWDNHKNLILSKIRHIVGLNNKQKIYARKCTVREISNKEKKDFLLANHVQGNCNSPIKIGCFLGDKLVSVMTMTTPRMIMKKKFEEGVYELSRFASDVNYNVVGTASKMLKYFKDNYKWKQIYSYADKRWSKSGNLYKTLGFTQDQDSDQNYYYSKDGVVHHRFKFAKHNIKKLFPNEFDEKLTEYQNMLNLGYDRFWDCGNFKFTIDNK